MGRYCYGSFLKILTLCSPRATTQKYLCGTMFLVVNPIYDLRGDDGTVGHLKACRDNVSPSVTDYIGNINISALVHCFEKDIIPKLNQAKLKNMILAIRDILIRDDGIDDSAVIGSVLGKKKGEYRFTVEFHLPEMLADFMIFSLQGIDNSSGAPYIGEIDKTYIDSFDAQASGIRIVQQSAALPMPLGTTLTDRYYKNTFEEVASAKLGLSNPEDFRIFRLKLEDYEFTYGALQKFLTQNLGRYVHSRAKMNRYKMTDDLESVGVEAAQLLRDNGTGDDLGPMMLYAFLEKELQAPKILSQVELASGISQCAGIHLLSLGGSATKYQLVYGASDVQGDLKSAIDQAFDEVRQIKGVKPNAMTLVESTAFKCAFNDPAMTSNVISMILPSKSGQENAATAYGIFLGYTLKMQSAAYSLSLDDFKQELKLQLETDITSQVSYIMSKIQGLRMAANSFYIYVLPFNDADMDKKVIMSKLIGGSV